MNDNVSKINQRLNADAFTLVNQNCQNSADQVFGKYSNFFVNVLKRYCKRPVGLLALFTFVVLILLMIIVPATSQFGINTSISTEAFSSNLRPRIPALGLAGTYQTVLTQAQVDQYKKIVGFIVHENPPLNGNVLVTINPYALDAFKNYYPIFGTNSAGYDLWTQTWYATAESMKLAVIVALVSVVLGVVYGAFAGWFTGKWVDLLLMRFVEVFDSIPTILWILILAFVFKTASSSQISDSALIPALIFVYWTGSAILTRTYVYKSKDADYVQAAKSLGASVPRLLFLHMLPNFIGRLVVRFVSLIPGVIFLEATLVFLGVKDVSQPTLGSIIFAGNESGILKPYALWAPIIITVLLMISTRFMALGLNDAIDPRNNKKTR